MKVTYKALQDLGFVLETGVHKDEAAMSIETIHGYINILKCNDGKYRLASEGNTIGRPLNTISQVKLIAFHLFQTTF